MNNRIDLILAGQSLLSQIFGGIWNGLGIDAPNSAAQQADI